MYILAAIRDTQTTNLVLCTSEHGYQDVLGEDFRLECIQLALKRHFYKHSLLYI